MIRRTRTLSLAFLMAAMSLAGSALPAATPRAPNPTPQDADQPGGFGRPESITGTISMVRPDEGLLIVTQQGPGKPASTVITTATEITQNPDGTTTKADAGIIAVAPGPGETDYRFRVTASTLIRVNGQSVASLGNLANMRDKQVTVHFIPQRNGNFAKGIEVSP